MVAEGELPRMDVVEYFRGLLRGGLKRQPDFVWTAIMIAAHDLYPEELLPDIRQAYADDLVETWFIRLEDVLDVLPKGPEKTLQASKRRRGGLSFGFAKIARNSVSHMAYEKNCVATW